MFKRPTSRRKTKKGPVTLNLVPMLDALITLIAFLLYTMSFLVLVSIESPVPFASTKSVEEKLREKPLQLTLSIMANEVQIWSPFDRIPVKTIPNQGGGQPNYNEIHNSLVGVKQQFPHENQIVFVPQPGSNYDILVQLMDISRLLDAGDPPIFLKGKDGHPDQPVTKLFDKIIFGNLLGDN
ncbi:MAG: biopolymer transporter ExbD [Bacteriovoracia bacterium]